VSAFDDVGERTKSVALAIMAAAIPDAPPTIAMVS
jgi:hypothetical protein